MITVIRTATAFPGMTGEAIAWAKQCPASENEIIEIRQVREIGDFSEDVQEVLAGFQNWPQGRVQ